MDTKDLDKFFAYWRSLPIAEGAKVPAKSTFSPLAMKPYLASIGILERIDRYNYQVRLFGTNLDDKFGMALTGTNLFDVLGEKQLEFNADYFGALLDTPAGGIVQRESVDVNDNTVRGMNMTLPLADEAGKIRFSVGMMLIESDSALNDPLDASRLHLAKVISAEYMDIGHGLPANLPALPG